MSQAEAGKGSNRRPEDQDAYSEGWDRIFGRKKREEALDELVRLSQEMGLYDDKVDESK